MADGYSLMSVVRKTLKEKRVGFDVSDFGDDEFECLNDHVAIFLGNTYHVVNRLFESSKGSFTRKQRRQRLGHFEILQVVEIQFLHCFGGYHYIHIL